jgi:hypothetical protein
MIDGQEHGAPEAGPVTSAGEGDARAATLALLACRRAEATLCPSEVARTVAAGAGKADWRGEMAGVHAAIDALLADGLVRLSWKGEAKPVREGPYRIGRAGSAARGE